MLQIEARQEAVTSFIFDTEQPTLHYSNLF